MARLAGRGQGRRARAARAGTSVLAACGQAGFALQLVEARQGGIDVDRQLLRGPGRPEARAQQLLEAGAGGPCRRGRQQQREYPGQLGGGHRTAGFEVVLASGAQRQHVLSGRGQGTRRQGVLARARGDHPGDCGRGGMPTMPRWLLATAAMTPAMAVPWRSQAGPCGRPDTYEWLSRTRPARSGCARSTPVSMSATRTPSPWVRSWARAMPSVTRLVCRLYSGSLYDTPAG